MRHTDDHMTVYQALVEALDYLERVDWIQGRMRRRWWWRVLSGDGACGIGAVERVIPGDLCGPLGTACVAALSEAVGRHFPVFNDGDGRTREDIVRAFRAAIEMTAPRPVPRIEDVIDLKTGEPVGDWRDLGAVGWAA